jgi:L-amino acid N-acyltransferase YncA
MGGDHGDYRRHTLPSLVDLRACRVMVVRRARIEDVEAMALIMAAVAEEGTIGTEPPVDVDARAQRFREVFLEHAHACGAHKVELEVWVDNARAIALYASAGFEVEGLRRDHYRRRDGQLRSALLMARLLQSP